MARLPPPPNVGRGSSQSESAASEDAAREADAARLPSSVVDLPDAWLLDANAPPPTPLRDGPAFPTFDDTPAQADPLVGISVAAPVEPKIAEPLPPAPPAVEVIAPAVEVEVAVMTATRASEMTPTTPTPRAAATMPSDANRRTVLTAGGVLGAVLLVVMIMRCSSDDSPAPPGKAAVATARTFDGGSADATPSLGATRTNGVADAKTADGAKADDAKADDAAGAPTDPAVAPSDAAAPPTDAAAEAKADADEPIAADEPNDEPDAAPASTGAKPSSARTDNVAPSKPSPDANLTAAENLEKARVTWKAGNAKDTYKYANKSRFKEPTDEATELATLSACKMKLDEAAKSSYKQLGGDRKKRTRLACREFGVRVGL